MNTMLQEAADECRAYSRLGGLNDDIIADIPRDHGVDEADLRREIEWPAA